MSEESKNVESKTFHDFRDEDIANYEVVNSDHEDEYDPVEDAEDLPDLYRFLEVLNSAETDLDGPHEPPQLFTQPQHKHNFNNIQLLKYEADEERVHEYVEEFETAAADEVLAVGKISLEDIQEEEKQLRDEHIAFQQQELDREKLRQQELLKVEEDAKKRVALDLKEKRRVLARKTEIAKQKERLQLDALHKTFKRAENKLTTNLTNEGAEVKTMYGDLSLVDGEYGGAKGRRWKLDWVRTPQPVQIKLKSLRGVKDKLPGGRYVLMVSIYNRVGGSVMRWSKLKGQQWGGATLPIIHNGNFYNYDMKIGQSVFAVLPPAISLRPSMVLVFELFLLRGSVVQTDKVVSWGCFPICDSNMDIIQGLHKTPFLRSEMDSRIDKHTKIEGLMSSDLDHWMCNLYFEVVQLPKYMAGQKEYEAELQFSADLLTTSGNVTDTGYEAPKTPVQYIQGSDLWGNSANGDKSHDPDTTSRPPTADHRPPTADHRPPTADHRPPTADHRPPTAQETGSDEKTSTYYTGAAQEEIGRISPDIPKRPMTTFGSRFAKREHKVQLDDESSSSESEIDDEQIVMMRDGRMNHLRPVKGVPGITYKRYLNESGDMYAKKMYTLLPKSAVLKKKKDARKLTYREKLQQHSFSVKTQYKDDKGESRRQAEHVRRQMLIALGLSDPKSTEFWTMIIMFIITFFIRIYVHYIGQWLYLTAQRIPVSGFVFLPYMVQIQYHNTLLHTIEEIFVVAIGPMTVFFIFVLGVMFCAATQRALGSFPEIGHKFLFCFGLQAMLDPFFIAIVDAVIKSWDLPNLPSESSLADFSKMYWHFVRTEGTGVGGILVTTIIYLFTLFVSASILYMYFLRLHNNGRMMDVYWRLHASEDELYIPYDLEISLPELDSVCKKAEQWRGEEGERRKVAVYEYQWEEEYEEEGKVVIIKEKTTHISIHTVHLDGLRELYRHFLVATDGAIVEVFGETSATELEERTKTPINSQSFFGSQASLHKVKGRRTVFTRATFREDTTLNGDTSESRQSFTSSKDAAENLKQHPE